MDKRPALLARCTITAWYSSSSELMLCRSRTITPSAVSELPVDFPPTRALPVRHVDAPARTRGWEIQRGHRDGHIVEPSIDRVTVLLGLGL